MEPMVGPSHLTAFQGAPFDLELVEIAEASVRAEAGWHIAPVVTETFTFPSWLGGSLFLPSGRVVSVDAVRVGGVAVLTGWELAAGGVLYRSNWYWQPGVVEVDVTHGYETVPLDLLPVIAARASAYRTDRSVARQAMGPYQVGFRDLATASDPAILRYSIAPTIA